MDDVELIIVNEENYKKYKDILNIAFDYDLDCFEMKKKELRKSNIESESIFKWINCFKKEFSCELNADKIVIATGLIGKVLVDGLPVRACTLILDNLVYIFIALIEDINLLKRVFLHEWTHSIRIKKIGMKSYKEYLNYLSNNKNVLFEEILSLSVEKYLNNNLTWEEISNIEYNEIWKQWDSEKKYNKMLEYNNLSGLDSLSHIYYLAYHICRRTMKPKVLKKLLFEERSIGMKVLIKCFNIYDSEGVFDEEAVELFYI